MNRKTLYAVVLLIIAALLTSVLGAAAFTGVAKIGGVSIGDIAKVTNIPIASFGGGTPPPPPPLPLGDYQVSYTGGQYKTWDESTSTYIYEGSSASAAIQAGLTAAQSGDTVIIQAGTYTMDSTTIQLRSEIDIEGTGSPILDYSSAGSGIYAMTGTGTIQSKIYLTANANLGVYTVSIADAGNFAPGDLVFITTTAVWKTNEYGQPQGELQYVQSKTSNTVTFTEPLKDTYTTANNAALQIVTPIEDVTISGLHFMNTVNYKNMHGIKLDYAANVKIEDCIFDKIEYDAMAIYTSKDITISNNTVTDTWKDGQGYGVMVAWGSDNVTINDNNFYQCRHCTDVGGGGGRPGIPRNITISNNYAEDGAILLPAGGYRYTYMYHTHYVGEDINFIGNEATGLGDGIVFTSYSGLIQGNNVHDMKNNDGDGVGYGIMVMFDTSMTGTGTITIDTNTVDTCDVAGIYLDPETTTVVITSNDVTNSGTYGIQSTADNIDITGNTVTTYGTYGIYLTSTSSNNTGTGNNVTPPGGNAIKDLGSANNVT